MDEQKLCTWIFNGLCWIATTTVVVYWIYEFSLNEDLCVVDYKKFYEDGSDPYPVLSMCFANPFVNSKLEGIGAGINKRLYSMYLGGEYFNTRMLDIDYKNVTIDINDFVTEYFTTWRNGTLETVPIRRPRNIFKSTFSAFWYYDFYQCYGMHAPPDPDIQHFGVLMNMSIFPNATRPQSAEFFTLLHSPNQLSRSVRTVRYMWSKMPSNRTYEMIFKINKVEIIRRRNKRHQPCHESSNHDNRVLVEHTTRVGCKAPYQNPTKEIRKCSTMKEIKDAKLLFRTDEYGTIPPCRAMEKLSYHYLESPLNDEKWGIRKGKFWVSFSLYDQYFQEIIKTRYFYHIYYQIGIDLLLIRQNIFP